MSIAVHEFLKHASLVIKSNVVIMAREWKAVFVFEETRKYSGDRNYA